MTAIKPSPPIPADPALIATACENLAKRAREKGNLRALADYEAGRCVGWAVRHEVGRLLAEREVVT